MKRITYPFSFSSFEPRPLCLAVPRWAEHYWEWRLVAVFSQVCSPAAFAVVMVRLEPNVAFAYPPGGRGIFAFVAAPEDWGDLLSGIAFEAAPEDWGDQLSGTVFEVAPEDSDDPLFGTAFGAASEDWGDSLSGSVVEAAREDSDDPFSVAVDFDPGVES